MTEYSIVVVGAGGVGKSALTVRFFQGKFVQQYDPTIEDSYRKQLEVDGKAYMLDIYDTAGQEEYKSLRDQYLKNAQGIVLVYSVTSSNSLQLAVQLRERIMRLKEDTPDIPIVLVGNKCDLDDQRQVSYEKGHSVAQQFAIPFLESSAKTNKNVREIFVQVVRGIVTYEEKHPDFQKKKKERKVRRSVCVIL